ncbi:MAG: hypothetical protein QHH26_12400 [Armatimonadota bacterium]|nr:hypothetical protein [Armatimonadota bacterium]
MCRRKVFALVLALVVAAIFSGCSKMENNPKFARKILSCVYDGSLRPISKHLRADLENVLTDSQVAYIGKILREKYGKPQRVMKGKTTTYEGETVTTYVVEAQKGSYRMIITIDNRNMIAGLYFPEAEE